MINISNLHKSYGKFPVLKGLNMNVGRGDIYGFIGKNGCGKTTTMNIITNIIEKDSGDISFTDEEQVEIGYLPESPSIYSYMNSVEYLTFIGACCEYQGDIKKRVDEILGIVGLYGARNRRIKGYSRGMVQRLGIGAAIFKNPKLLLLDEPTSALDPEGRAEVMGIISNLRNMGTTIILSTHILTDVERIATKVGIVRDGIIAVEGTVREILNRFGSNEIRLSLFNFDENAIKTLTNLNFAETFYSEKENAFYYRGENHLAVMEKLIALIATTNYIPESISVISPSLEEIYFKVVNENAI